MTLTADKGSWTLDEWLQTEMEPRCELENGRLLPMASPTRRHNDVVAVLYYHLRLFLKERRAGIVAMEVDVALPNQRGYIPDVSVLYGDQTQRLLTPEGKICGAPYLVVEVISPTTRTRDTVHKLRAYYEAGVAWYWLIDSETLTAQEYQHTPEGYLLRTVAEAEEPFAPKALEGFRIELSKLIGDE